MNIKYNLEDVIIVAEKLGFKLISEIYISVTEKLILKDNEGYFYYTAFRCLQNNDMPCKIHPNNPYSIKNIELWLSLNKNNFTLLDTEYELSDKKLNFMDNNGFLYKIILLNLMNNKSPRKFHISNPYTIQNIKLWCKLNNKPFELVSDTYNGNNKKLRWKCSKEECGEMFETSWSNVFDGRGCAICAGRQVGLSNCLATKNPELAKEWHPTKNGKLTPYTVACGSNKNVWWQCSKNPEHEWKTSIVNRYNLTSNCPYCSGRLPTKENNLLVVNPKLCEEWDYSKNKNKPEDYLPNSGKKVWWICRECNNEWYAQILARNIGRGCPDCAESKGEKEISQYLKFNKIKYESQKTFEGLYGLGGGLLLYDFYLLRPHNMLIEYDGEYHYQVIKYKNESMEFAEEKFRKQTYHDRLKDKYAQINNIKLIRIPYWEFDRIKEILDNEFHN